MLSVKHCSFWETKSDSIVQFPSNSYTVNQIIVCLLCALLTVATILLNGTAIVTICRNFYMKEKVCYFLIFLQSTVDYASGTVSIPLFTFVLSSEIAGTPKCVVNFIVSSVAFIPMAMSRACSVMWT